MIMLGFCIVDGLKTKDYNVSGTHLVLPQMWGVLSKVSHPRNVCAVAKEHRTERCSHSFMGIALVKLRSWEANYFSRT